MTIAKLETSFDRIQKFYREGYKLNAQETEMCQRLEMAFSLLCETRVRTTAVKKYIAVLKQKGKTIAYSTAQHDFIAAEQLFAPIFKYTKEYLKLVVIESAIKDINRSEKILDAIFEEFDSNQKQNVTKKKREDKTNLLSSHNLNMYQRAMKSKDMAERRIIEASGLNVNDPNLPDFSKLQMNQFNINVSPDIYDFLKSVVSKGAVNVTELIKGNNG